MSDSPQEPVTAPAAAASPLHARHVQADAEFQSYGGVEIVSTFGEPQAEYAAIRKGCALLDLPQRAFIEISGKDRLAFLNNLLTNATWDKSTKSGLTAGQGVYAFFLNIKGRLTADLNVLERGEQTLIETDARLIPAVVAGFDRYLFGEQVKMTSRVGQLHEMALHGPGAAAVLDAAAGSHVVELPPMGSQRVDLFGVAATIWRDDPCGVPGLHLIVPTESAEQVWDELIARFHASADLGRRALRPAGWAAFNATRIEAGRALFGIDFDEALLPAETGQFDRAVSLTKGCYLGQEIVARMHARQQVARRVMGLRVNDGHLPVAGAPLYDVDSNVVGGVTSSTVSPVLSRAALALALVKKPFFGEGTVLRLPAEGSLREATVVKLPFLSAEPANDG